MFNTSRREFVQTLGAFALFPFERTEPDLILYNGNFWTVDPHTPRAQAVAIGNCRFIAVGSNEEVLNLAAGRSRKVDLGQKTVLPGFIDAHTHPAESGRLHLRQVDCDLRSIGAIQDSAPRTRGENATRSVGFGLQV
jgi:predicted amidohydrolase YtcJ